MKKLIIIISLLTLISCEIERNCTGYCYTPYKYDWNVKENPQLSVFAETYGCNYLSVKVQNKPFTNYEIKGDMLIFNSTNEIKNMCLVVITIEVEFKKYK